MKIQKEKKPHFSQLLLARYVMTTHVPGTWKILVVFITHVLFITCVCCRKKTTKVLIQGCLLYHIHQDLFKFFLTQLPSLLSKALSSEDLRTAQWKKSEVVWQKLIWTSFWWMNAITLCNALIGKKNKLKQVG